MNSKPKLILIGGGGHCKSCIDVIESEDKFTIAGILDAVEKKGQDILVYPIIGTDDDIPSLVQQDYHFLITIGQIKNPKTRIKIFQQLKQLKAFLPVIVSPSAVVSKHAKIQEGTIIMHHVIINADANIAKNCIINNKALIEHDASVGTHTHISTNAVVNGNCTIGERCFIGSSSVINHGVRITNDIIIGSGTVVRKDIIEPGIYVGNPIRKFR